MKKTAEIFALCLMLLPTTNAARAAVFFSEDFENGLDQWIGRDGGVTYGVIVPDPLGSGRGQVLSFSQLISGGDIYTTNLFTATGTLCFDYLGLPSPNGVQGDLGGFLGIMDTFSVVGPWLAGTADNYPGLIVPLIDDGAWHHYSIALDGAPLGAFHLVLEDYFGSDGIPGDVFFDNLRIESPAGLSINHTNRLEGQNGLSPISFTVTLTSPSCQTVKVDVATANGTALAGEDYQAVQTNLIFLPGVTEQLVIVPILGDTKLERDETFSVCLANPVNAFIIDSCSVGTIINDDTPGPPTVAIISPTEGATFTVPPGTIPITVNAQDSDGTVVKVDFYSGTNFNYLGAATNAPFTFQWMTSALGTNVLIAVATDNSGASATSAPVRIILVSCSGSLTARPLANQSACICETVVFTSEAASSDPITFVWKANGRVIPGQTSSNLVLQSLKPADAGIYTVELTTPCQHLTNSASLTIEAANLPNPLVLSNSTPVMINDGNDQNSAPATPYPSAIQVRCVPGVIKKVTATLFGLSHSSPHDLDILLAAPSRKAIELLSDAGVKADRINLTFSDAASGLAPPFFAEIFSGTYKPTDYAPTPDPFPSPAPPPPYLTNLSDFNGASPNGAWELYVVDDETLDTGIIAGGWSITIDWEDSPPRLRFPTNLPGDRFQMVLSSQPGQTYVIEASTDLQNWLPLSTNTMIGTNMSLIFPQPGTPPRRFFRVVRCPTIDLFATDPPQPPVKH